MPASPPGTDSPEASPAAVTPSTGAAGTAGRKQVRVVEPDVEALEALREYWTGVGTPLTGIGGYRRTRLFYSKSQGGPGSVRRTRVRRGVPLTPGQSDDEDQAAGVEEEEDEEDSSDDTTPMTAIDTPTPIGRPGSVKPAAPAPPARTSSLSPSKPAAKATKKRDNPQQRSPASPKADAPLFPLPSSMSLRTQPAFVASRPGIRRRASSGSPVPVERATLAQAGGAGVGQTKARGKKNAQGGGPTGGGAVTAKVTYVEDAAAGVGGSSSEFEDATTDEDATKTHIGSEGNTDPSSPPSRVTITLPAVVKPATPPPTGTQQDARAAAASTPTGTATESVSPTSSQFPRRTGSIAAAERPAGMLSGRTDSFGEASPRALVA